MPTKKKSPAAPSAYGDHVPWTAEPGEDGFWRVVNSQGIIIAQKCVQEEAQQFAALPEFMEALDRLLELTVDTDLAQGIELTEKEEDVRKIGLAAFEKANGNAA